MLRTSVILKIVGLLLMLFSSSFVVPLSIAIFSNDGNANVFVYSMVICFSAGAIIWIPYAKHHAELRARDGFMITVLFWVLLGLTGSLPFLLSSNPNMSVVDSVFESISGLTTTGATVLVGLDNYPPSILFYRQLLQWMGGIGIVVIAVAVLPLLGVGGMQLYRAETPGPIKDNKLTPRIAETAKVLFYIYVTLTVICTFFYWLAGMSLFDAVSHAFSTLSIGGFSTHDESMGWFLHQEDVNADAVVGIATFFMILAGLNFALHYTAFFRVSLRQYFRDPEARFYLRLMLFGVVVVVAGLYLWNVYGLGNSFLHGLFQTTSIMTTAGFTTANFSDWPLHLGFFLMILSFFGACAGSTGGGIKIGRMMILAKQTLREIARLIHPNAVIQIKMGDRPVNPRVTDAIWGFFGAYLIIFFIMVFLLLASGLDFVTAWSAVAATINNLGPGLGDVGNNYQSLNDFAKWVLCFCMVLGRLELFTLIVLFIPMFWRG